MREDCEGPGFVPFGIYRGKNGGTLMHWNLKTSSGQELSTAGRRITHYLEESAD